MRAISLNNRPILPQRASTTKELYSINKVPEYSPEYRPELIILPPTHRENVDDDKGPIHTIPAPNLSLADKPYNAAINLENIADHQPHQPSNDLNYHVPVQSKYTNFHYITQLYFELVKMQMMIIDEYYFRTDLRRTNFGLATVSNSLSSQGTVTNSIPSQHQYEVTESNDVIPKEQQTIQSVIFQPQDLDATKLYSIIINNPQPQSNELFANHPVNSDTSVLGLNTVQFGQSNMPMQTNLHSSLHVGFPSTAIPQIPYAIAQQIPEDLHIGHPATAGPPLSASQLYNLLNNFPPKLVERYTTGNAYLF